MEQLAQPVKVFIDTFADKKIYVIPDPSNFELPIDKDYSIKFNVGTEVYFIKTSFKVQMNRVYIDMNTKVIQLKRRKEPRYLLPKNWTQSAAILVTPTEHIKCNVADISNSGIRLEILGSHPDYNRDDFVKIKFQIHKRGEVTTTAVVRFILRRPNANTLLGLEYIEISNTNQARVTGVVNDIQMYNTTPKT
jgi:c-di-GMP-binding flagellar brake protein YcgR